MSVAAIIASVSMVIPMSAEKLSPPVTVAIISVVITMLPAITMMVVIPVVTVRMMLVVVVLLELGALNLDVDDSGHGGSC